MVLCLLTAPAVCHAQIGTFQSDFNSGLPQYAYAHGNAAATGGRMRLVPAANSQQGAMIIENLSGTRLVTAFDVTCDVFTGNAANPQNPADGWSFAAGTFDSAAFGEEGPQTNGLVVVFDYYINFGAGETARTARVKWNGVQVASVNYQAYTNSTVPVHIRLSHGGLLDVWHNGNRLFKRLQLPGFTSLYAPEWAFGARTGGETAEVAIDNLRIAPLPVEVTSTADSGAGSLRQAVADALANGTTPDQIHFAAALSGETITLSGSPIETGAQNLVIDATMLSGGLSVSGGDAVRLLQVTSGAPGITLNGLAFTHGKAASAEGGGILSRGSLEMNECSLTDCEAGTMGGGLYLFDGTTTLNRCTFARNTAAIGGAIWKFGSTTLTLDRCTLYGNTATTGNGGGMLVATGPASLAHCTVAGNASASRGGGVCVTSSASAAMADSIVAGNTAPTNGDISIDSAILSVSGTNIVGVYDPAVASVLPAGQPNAGGNWAGTAAAPVDAKLGAFGNRGGRTPSMVPQQGSPAVNAADASTSTQDQRGFAVFQTPDAGACEAQLGPVDALSLLEDFSFDHHFSAGTAAVLTASSSNTALVSAGAIGTTGSATVRTVALVPVAHQNGTATITLNDSVSGESTSFQLTVVPVNDAPSFTAGSDVSAVSGNTVEQSVTGWATNISPGPGESGQTLAFTATTDNDALFSELPTISATGTLNYTLAPQALGRAVVSVRLSDDGGTAHGGADASAAQTFSIAAKTGWFTDFSSAVVAPATRHGLTSLAGGALRLVPATSHRQGSLIVSGLAGSSEVATFDTTFDVTTSGAGAEGPAEGYSFAWGALPPASFGEEGPASLTGLVVSFDYNPGGTELQKEVVVTWNGSRIAAVAYDSYTNSTVPVHIRLRQGGLLDVWHAGNRLFDGLALPGFTALPAPHWGIGARNAARYSEVLIDNLQINLAPFTVTTTADSGAGSLRQAMADAAGSYAPGPDQIQFSPALAGQTVVLATPLVVGPQTVVVDGTALGGQAIISGGNASRLIEAGNTSSHLALHRLTLTGGTTPAIPGGGIVSGGVLEMADVTLSQCSGANSGGGIVVYSGSITAARCTFSGNSAGSGGVIWAIGGTSLAFSRCTFSGNAATAGSGGAILLAGGAAQFTHCTLAGNTAASGGGGLHADSGTVFLADSIVAGNTAASDPDLWLASSTITAAGVNLLGTAIDAIPAGQPNAGGSYAGSPGSPIDPLLAPLGSYGGWTQTRPLRAGSLARNAATGSSSTSDQRGYGMSGVPDIGAYEAGHDADFFVWAAENAASSVPLAAAGDEDGDGQSNLAEYAFRTDPLSPGSFGKLTRALDGSISFPVRRPGDVNLRYTLETSSDLHQWSTAGSFQISPESDEIETTSGVSGNYNEPAGTFTFSFSQAALAADRRFWRVDVSQF